MANNVTVAWAIPVEPATLGASIEAYATAQQTMFAFEEYTNSTSKQCAVRGLARELLDTISTYVRQLAFVEQSAEWTQALACFRGRCSTANHYESWKREYLTEMGYNQTTGGGSGEAGFTKERFYEWLLEPLQRRRNEEHCHIIENLEIKIGERARQRYDGADFREARELFSTDFSLDIHFQVYNEEPNVLHIDQAIFEDKWLKAYIILPTTYAIMKRSRLPGATAFHAAMFVHPSTRRTPSKQQKTLFSTAMATLGLEISVDPISSWTCGRFTSERYRKTGLELKGIEQFEATNSRYRPRYEYNNDIEREIKLKGMGASGLSMSKG